MKITLRNELLSERPGIRRRAKRKQSGGLFSARELNCIFHSYTPQQASRNLSAAEPYFWDAKKSRCRSAPAFLSQKGFERALKKRHSVTFLARRAAETFIFSHAATSEQKAFQSGNVLLGRQKSRRKSVPAFICPDTIRLPQIERFYGSRFILYSVDQIILRSCKPARTYITTNRATITNNNGLISFIFPLAILTII